MEELTTLHAFIERNGLASPPGGRPAAPAPAAAPTGHFDEAHGRVAAAAACPDASPNVPSLAPLVSPQQARMKHKLRHSTSVELQALLRVETDEVKRKVIAGLIRERRASKE